MGKKSIHVVPTGDRWGTIRDGGSRHSNLADKQREVIAAARDQARRDGVELFIHGEDGKIRERNSYGNDPYPPRG